MRTDTEPASGGTDSYGISATENVHPEQRTNVEPRAAAGRGMGTRCAHYRPRGRYAYCEPAEEDRAEAGGAEVLGECPRNWLPVRRRGRRVDRAHQSALR